MASIAPDNPNAGVPHRDRPDDIGRLAAALVAGHPEPAGVDPTTSARVRAVVERLTAARASL